MKAIMLSIRPESVAKILNGEKTIEIRKSVPKDFNGWIYIYCTKQFPVLIGDYINVGDILNGKVVARFWFDEWEEIKNEPSYYDDWIKYKEKTCVDFWDWYWYFTWSKKSGGYAWHIKKLEIFNTPKELSEFENRYAPPPNWYYIEVKEVIENDKV